MQNQILELKNEIKKYFACHNVSAFKPSANCNRDYLSVIRNVLRMQGFIFEGTNYLVKDENNKLQKSIRYIIFRNN